MSTPPFTAPKINIFPAPEFNIVNDDNGDDDHDGDDVGDGFNNDDNNVSTESETEFTARERRILLQKMFMQVLLRLCVHKGAVEELARKDDLTLLFSAITSVCPRHNMIWRKTSGDVLLTISRYSIININY